MMWDVKGKLQKSVLGLYHTLHPGADLNSAPRVTVSRKSDTFYVDVRAAKTFARLYRDAALQTLKRLGIKFPHIDSNKEGGIMVTVSMPVEKAEDFIRQFQAITALVETKPQLIEDYSRAGAIVEAMPRVGRTKMEPGRQPALVLHVDRKEGGLKPESVSLSLEVDSVSAANWESLPEALKAVAGYTPTQYDSSAGTLSLSLSTDIDKRLKMAGDAFAELARKQKMNEVLASHDDGRLATCGEIIESIQKLHQLLFRDSDKKISDINVSPFSEKNASITFTASEAFTRMFRQILEDVNARNSHSMLNFRENLIAEGALPLAAFIHNGLLNSAADELKGIINALSNQPELAEQYVQALPGMALMPSINGQKPFIAIKTKGADAGLAVVIKDISNEYSNRIMKTVGGTTFQPYKKINNGQGCLTIELPATGIREKLQAVETELKNVAGIDKSMG